MKSGSVYVIAVTNEESFDMYLDSSIEVDFSNPKIDLVK